MAYARSVTSGRERSASTLVNGGHATGDRTSFSCLFCDLPVSLVRRRGCAHFRHAAGTSCLFKLDAESAAEREEIEELAKTRIANRSSDFCRRWRSLFPEECRKGRRHARPDDGKAHVPDVELGAGTAGSAVIEIQHSVVPASDLVSRERAYPNDVTWILDCTSIVIVCSLAILKTARVSGTTKAKGAPRRPVSSQDTFMVNGLNEVHAMPVSPWVPDTPQLGSSHRIALHKLATNRRRLLQRF